MERTPEACTNLSCGRFVLCWKRREGIEVLAKPIFVRGVAPSMAGAPCARKGLSPFNGWRSVPPSPRIQNHYAKSGSWGFLERTPEAYTNLSCWRFVFCWNGEGIEVLAKPIFVRAQPFNGWRPVPPSPRIQNHYAKSGSWGFLERTPEACTNLSCGRFVLCWKRR